MAVKKIDPKGISRAGQNGSPPSIPVMGSAPNARTKTNVPGGVPSRTGSKTSEGATKKPSKGRRNPKGNQETLKTGTLKTGKSTPKSSQRGFKSTQADTKNKGQRTFKA